MFKKVLLIPTEQHERMGVSDYIIVKYPSGDETMVYVGPFRKEEDKFETPYIGRYDMVIGSGVIYTSPSIINSSINYIVQNTRKRTSSLATLKETCSLADHISIYKYEYAKSKNVLDKTCGLAHIIFGAIDIWLDTDKEHIDWLLERISDARKYASVDYRVSDKLIFKAPKEEEHNPSKPVLYINDDDVCILNTLSGSPDHNIVLDVLCDTLRAL